jgi:hypothetical protein
MSRNVNKTHDSTPEFQSNFPSQNLGPVSLSVTFRQDRPSLTREQKDTVARRSGYRCVYCGVRCKGKGIATFDHIIPVTRAVPGLRHVPRPGRQCGDEYRSGRTDRVSAWSRCKRRPALGSGALPAMKCEPSKLTLRSSSQTVGFGWRGCHFFFWPRFSSFWIA